VLRIDRALHDAIVAHAREDHPREACGIIAGPIGSDHPQRFIAMENVEPSPTTAYSFGDEQRLKVFDEMDLRDEEPIVVYHSHTATEAYPSRTDVFRASIPKAHYVLVSTRDPEEVEFRSFRIMSDLVIEHIAKIAALRDRFATTHGREPTDEEIGRELDVPILEAIDLRRFARETDGAITEEAVEIV
jgi:[CysO sulfur-carrier protein]-S-L-cysteine hydrolase